ncbi:hypothetical protein [Rhodococcus sp. USK13]|uniref:hypothetical protein n=1 Tax=Rhodococcus sp. USK13 TaxID=2806442 RepID=UPI0020174A11|nr:hypothetical protein [Rhodococcus sp. USK13]
MAPGEAEPRPQARVSDSHGLLAAAFLDGATRLVAQNESGAEIRRISLLMFEVLDDFTGVAAAAFLDEQSAWAAGVSAARLDLATKIIAADPIELGHAEQVLGYPHPSAHRRTR